MGIYDESGAIVIERLKDTMVRTKKTEDGQASLGQSKWIPK